MNVHRILLGVAFAAASLAHAQTAPSAAPADHASHHATTVAAADAPQLLSEGEVRRIHRDTGKLTIKHGPLPNLDMPGMTMVFTVADPKLLDGLKEGDKIRFTAERKDGTYLVIALRVVQ